jgi:hypothetical protein
MTGLPDDLEHLQNIIAGAKNEPNNFEANLRRMIRAAADEASTADIIAISEAILDLSFRRERANRVERN